MARFRYWIIAALVGLSGYCVMVQAKDVSALSEVEVANAQLFLPKPHVSATGSRMTIYNRSSHKLVIFAVHSQWFSKSMLHQTSFINGQRQMHPVKSISIAPHHQLALTPNTTHLMFMGLKRNLAKGDLIVMTLSTNLGPLKIVAKVVPMQLR